MSSAGSVFVSAKWLAAHLGEPDLRVVDATWHLPELKRDARAEFRAQHIPGARYFDIDEVADPDHELGHMLPSAAYFAQKVGELGIGNNSRVVAYDSRGLYSAARVWWMFRVFGHDKAFILDGGLPKWLAEGRPTQTADPAPQTPAQFSPRERPELVRTAKDLLGNLQSRNAQIVDARTPGRFAGTERDPYEGVRAGRIPGSVNLYWATLLDPKTKTLLPPAELEQRFNAAGVEIDKPMMLSCGSGVTACIVASALQTLGRETWSVYDGSWDEWGRKHDLPIET